MTHAQILMNCPSMLNPANPDGLTATGTVPKVGHTIACEPSWKGKIINIIGLGERKCEDLGSAIKGNRVDVFFDTYEEAMNFGKREVAYTALP